MIESDDFNEQKDFCLNLMANLEKWDIHEILLSLKQMASYKDYIYDLLDIMTIYYRDILILKVTGLPNKTVFKEKFSVMKNQSIYLSFEGIDTIIKEIEKAKIRLKANVNFDVTLELLLFVMKENGET